MAGSSPEIVRKPRADAVRNRERVLEAYYAYALTKAFTLTGDYQLGPSSPD